MLHRISLYVLSNSITLYLKFLRKFVKRSQISYFNFYLTCFDLVITLHHVKLPEQNLCWCRNHHFLTIKRKIWHYQEPHFSINVFFYIFLLSDALPEWWSPSDDERTLTYKPFVLVAYLSNTTSIGSSLPATDVYDNPKKYPTSV